VAFGPTLLSGSTPILPAQVDSYSDSDSNSNGRPIGGDSGCGGSGGGLGWVGGDGERGWVSAGVIGCFQTMVLWCAKLTCGLIIGGQKTHVFCQDRTEGALIAIYKNSAEGRNPYTREVYKRTPKRDEQRTILKSLHK